MNQHKTEINAELQNRLARFEEQCRAKGLRVTQQRREIFCAVAQSCEHPSAEKVFQTVRQAMPNVSLDTVYRTLSSMEEAGLVSRVGNSNKARFDADLTPHAHFVCTACGEVYDVPAAVPDAALVPANIGEFGEVKNVNLQFRGICNRCRKAAGEKK